MREVRRSTGAALAPARLDDAGTLGRSVASTQRCRRPRPPRADRTLACRSDADAQLIVFFPFSQTVRLSAIILDAPEGDRPTVVKLFANRATLGFDELDDVEATQVRRAAWGGVVRLGR